MSEVNEEQAIEWEVLESIYEGDPDYKKASDARVQYKFGTGGEKAFLVEVEWPTDYPTVACNINMDVFYNQQMPDNVRKGIKDKLLEVAQENEGMASTFTIIEYVKENFDALVEDWSLIKMAELSVEDKPSGGNAESGGRKEQLTKSAKRRMWDRNEGTGCERGHNWVDILKHLSATGSAQ